LAADLFRGFFHEGYKEIDNIGVLDGIDRGGATSLSQSTDHGGRIGLLLLALICGITVMTHEMEISP
jgi:hypothetical protein